MHASLFGSGVLDGLAAAFLLAVGVILMRREIAAPEARFAWRAYCAWWLATGSALAVASGSILFAALGHVDASVVITQWFLERLFASVAAWGLLSYAIYLYTGRPRAWMGIAAAYAVVFVVWLAEVLARPPTQVVLHAWGRPMLEPAAQTPVLLATSALLFLLPPLGAAAAMVRAGFVLDHPLQRYRVLLAAASIPLLLVPGAFAFMLPWLPSVQLGARAVQLCGAALALLAYRPPARIARALGDVDAQALGARRTS